MRYYGKYRDDPKGIPQSPGCCIVEIFKFTGRTTYSPGTPIKDRKNRLSWQCHNYKGYGPKGSFCRRHARMLTEGKQLFIPEDEKETDNGQGGPEKA